MRMLQNHIGLTPEELGQVAKAAALVQRAGFGDVILRFARGELKWVIPAPSLEPSQVADMERLITPRQP